MTPKGQADSQPHGRRIWFRVPGRTPTDAEVSM